MSFHNGTLIVLLRIKKKWREVQKMDKQLKFEISRN